MQYAIYAAGECKKYIITGEIERAIIEPAETYFEKYVIVPQIAAIIKPATQLRARIVPTPDATDLPPLKFKKQDLLCPIITETAAITGIMPYKTLFPINRVVKITGNAPLKASNSKTMKNHFFPKTLLTFVAPVEPEPIVRRSCPERHFTTMYPVGIEPVMYETIKTIINFINKISINVIPFLLIHLYHIFAKYVNII